MSDCIRRAQHQVSPGQRANLLMLDGAITLRLSVQNCTLNNGAWGWFVPAGANNDFVLCALRPRAPDHPVQYALLRGGVTRRQRRWISAAAPGRSGIWLAAALEPLFGL